MSLTAYIEGIGLIGPGLADWDAARAVLAGRSAYVPAKTVIPAPEMLPSAERRRASDIVKLTLATSLQALQQAGQLEQQLPSVFSFSNGDGINCHAICEMLASEDRQISPTRFHNSVHNAAAGYWSIAMGNMATASVLCAFDASFAAGLLEAMTQVVVEGTRCILMASDTHYPEPMHSKRPIPDNFGVALVLAPQPGPAALARITLQLVAQPADACPEPALETLRQSIPSARALPLLAALDTPQPSQVVLDYLDSLRVQIDVTPC